MSRVVAVGTSLPAHAYRQDEISRVTSELLTDDPVRRALTRRLHAHAGVETRHLALPLEDYGGLSFGSANDAFLALGTDLAEQACRAALDDAGLRPDEVDHVVLTTVTGVGAPTLDVLVAARLGLRPDVRRTPSFGWGCAGGAAGLARADDLLRGRPRDVALLVAVELCSLTLQRTDPSTANIVASGLFGDGAGAAVLVGDEHRLARRPGPYGRAGAGGRARGVRVVDSRSHLHAGTTGDLGWRVGDTGFEIVLSARLPELIGAHLLGDVKALLAEHDLEPGDVGAWVVHAGGPRVLDAVRDTLGLAEEELALSRASLRDVGNLSSASVLHVLGATLARTDVPPGAPAVLMAFGPGVSTELVLLRLDGRGPRRAHGPGHAGEHAVARAEGVQGMSLAWYVVLVGATAVERLAELVVSARNARWSFARGGVESGRGHFPAMVALHTGLLLACVAEAWLADRPFLPWLGWPMLVLVLASQGLRWWCIATLGPRWNTRVIVVPGLPLVARGPYRWLRHPNYVAVVVEGVALPLVHSCWITAVAFTLLNAVLLARFRIPAEERALARATQAGAAAHPAVP